MKLLGLLLKRSKEEKEIDKIKGLPATIDNDGAVVIDNGALTGPMYSSSGYTQADYTQTNWLPDCRRISMYSQVSNAIDEIVNEAIIVDDEGSPVYVKLDSMEGVSESTKEKIRDEFDIILKKINFKDRSLEYFRNWYIDGKIFFYVQLHDIPKNGILDVRLLDTRFITKIKEVTTNNVNGVNLVVKEDEYYLYKPKDGDSIRISPDCIAYSNSGLSNEASYLQTAVRPANLLMQSESYVFVYRMTRTPNQRVFMIEVGNRNEQQAEQHLRQASIKFQKKIKLDELTGTVSSGANNQSIIDDIFLAMKGGQGSSVTTLNGGINVGELNDVYYFQSELYKSLHVPLGRLKEAEPFANGRVVDVNRDEVAFNKFIIQLRRRFSRLLYHLLKIQLINKGTFTPDDWEEHRDDIIITFVEDNYFNELKNLELQDRRLDAVDRMMPYLNIFYSKEYIAKNILNLPEDYDKDFEDIPPPTDENNKTGNNYNGT